MKIQIRRLGKILEAKRIQIELTPEAEAEIARRGYDPAFGARPLKRVIQRDIQNALAMELLTGKIREGDTILVELHGEEFVFTPAPRVKED